MSDLSVITLVKDRAAHLDRLIAGVARSEKQPKELIVVDMSDQPVSLPAIHIPMVNIRLSSAGLPLAAARNRGAEASSGTHLLFLDIDCIPMANLVANMDEALAREDALICAEVRYLGPEARAREDDTTLHAASVTHPHRYFPTCGLRRENNAGLFWSLLFGIRRSTFAKLGGFDGGYEGYGAEDTDFGFRADEAGLPLMFMGGTGGFHQYHGVIDPPLQHLPDIVRNANRFFGRWGLWPMEGWLAAFEALGLVARYDDRIELLRCPTDEEIGRARKPPDCYF